MIIGENCNPEIQRIRYKKGQLLASRDLRDDNEIADTLRWLHNRALHESYGVNYGMKVTENNVSSLNIEAGLAYDCYGRELILNDSRIVQIPSLSVKKEQVLILLIRYKETRTFTNPNEIIGVCLSDKAKPLLEQPEFFWKPETLLELKDGVPLAKVRYSNSENPVFEEKLDVPIPVSRPIARPRIGTGSTKPEETIWTPWKEDDYTVGMEAIVDTSLAEFTESPHYFASLQGAFWINGADEGLEFYLAPFESIADDASQNSFTFRILLPKICLFYRYVVNGFWLCGRYTNDINSSISRGELAESSLGLISEFFRKQELFISWIGIQSLMETTQNF